MLVFNWLVFLLVMIFGSSTWMTINAIWVELSLYTSQLPEGWALPSYLATIIQIACALTLVCSLIIKYTRFGIAKGTLIYILLIFASFCILALAFSWDKTVTLFGNQHSVALFVLTFCMALVCAASNLLFLPYMASFHPHYMNAYFVGMSLSSLVPSLLKIIQGVGNYNCVPTQDGNQTVVKAIQTEPLFGVMFYNLLIAAWMFAAAGAFYGLHRKSGPANENTEKLSRNDVSTQAQVQEDQQQQVDEEAGEGEKSPLKRNSSFRGADDISTQSNSHSGAKLRYWTLITMLTVICAEMNTIVPSVQSYATLAYSMLTYHLALTLSNMSHPVANFLPIWVKPRSLPILLALTAVCTGATAFIFLLALQSPEPMLRQSSPFIGSTLSIGASILTGFLCSYLRTHLTGLVRAEQANSEKALFWCGFFMQIGSFIGACAMFPLVNYANIFKKREPCSN